jgi:hypothetical protein
MDKGILEGRVDLNRPRRSVTAVVHIAYAAGISSCLGAILLASAPSQPQALIGGFFFGAGVTAQFCTLRYIRGRLA